MAYENYKASSSITKRAPEKVKISLKLALHPTCRLSTECWMEGKGEQLTAAGHRVGGACAERCFPHYRPAAPQQYRPADTVTAMTSCKQSCIQLCKITLFTGLFPSARATPLSAFSLSVVDTFVVFVNEVRYLIFVRHRGF